MPTGSISRCGGVAPIPGTVVSDVILAGPDLYAFYKLDESSGATAHDSGPNSLDASATGSPTFGNPPGPPGDTTAEVSPGNFFSRATGFGVTDGFSGDISFELWFQLHAGPVAGRMLAHGNPVSSNTGFSISADAAPANAVTLQVGDNSGPSGSIAVTVPVALDTWYYVGASQTTGIWRLYFNGAQVGGTLAKIQTGATDIFLGWGLFPPTGGLSYVAIYTRAISASEFAARYTLYTS